MPPLLQPGRQCGKDSRQQDIVPAPYRVQDLHVPGVGQEECQCFIGLVCPILDLFAADRVLAGTQDGDHLGSRKRDRDSGAAGLAGCVRHCDHIGARGQSKELRGHVGAAEAGHVLALGVRAGPQAWLGLLGEQPAPVKGGQCRSYEAGFVVVACCESSRLVLASAFQPARRKFTCGLQRYGLALDFPVSQQPAELVTGFRFCRLHLRMLPSLGQPAPPQRHSAQRQIAGLT